MLLLVPRHPERFNPVADLIEKPTLTLFVVQQVRIPSENTQVILGDTMGELMLMYGISDIAVCWRKFGQTWGDIIL